MKELGFDLNCYLSQAIYLDIAEGGMRFNNMDRGEFPIYAAITMLSVDTLLYGLLAVYFDNVMPGRPFDTCI